MTGSGVTRQPENEPEDAEAGKELLDLIVKMVPPVLWEKVPANKDTSVLIAREGAWEAPEPAAAIRAVMRAGSDANFAGMGDDEVRALRLVAFDFLRVADEELFYRRTVAPAMRAIAQASTLILRDAGEGGS
jgi:hypothetical protein